MSMLELLLKHVIIPYWKPLLVVLVMSGCVYGGWEANNYYTGYKESIDLKIEKQVNAALDQMQQESAKSYIETKQIMQDNAKVIETKIPYIVEREVYYNVCLDQDGVNVLKELKENSRKARNQYK
ncbi:hypothetical protein [Escherichia phage vB_EcoM_JNE01]|nr:hypothetical protein [Escherichia phage vB_EcoM_JNE01]